MVDAREISSRRRLARVRGDPNVARGPPRRSRARRADGRGRRPSRVARGTHDPAVRPVSLRARPAPRAPPRAAQAQGAPRRRGVPPPRRVRGSVPPRSQRHRHHVGAPDVHHVVPRGVLRRAQGAPSKRRIRHQARQATQVLALRHTRRHSRMHTRAMPAKLPSRVRARRRMPIQRRRIHRHVPRAQITQAHTSTRVVQNHERRRTPRSSSSRRRRRRARGRHGTRAGRHGTVGRHHASRSPRARRRAARRTHPVDRNDVGTATTTPPPRSRRASFDRPR